MTGAQPTRPFLTDRRTFVAVLAALGLTPARSRHAQEPGRVWRIGFLPATPCSSAPARL
ncbi:MAG TPA: hypothetical protein VMI34_03470 [Candidatus Bathyarchaeia archaeon]|nr:hypothetical protein [Candidatus Bathyarchaeia archaeon]